jgi:hypothetical protein
MKTFTDIREAAKKMPPGEHISSKKVGKVTVMVHKDKNGFATYIDGDKLDTYKSQKEAEKFGISFAKEL